MKLTLEQFETQWTENNLSVTDWFDTTYGLFKELKALQSRSCERCYWWNSFYEKCNSHDNSLAGTDGYYCNRYEAKEQL